MSSTVTTRPRSSELTSERPISPLAGMPAPKDILIDVGRLEREYFEQRPSCENPNELVIFGTNGHRGSPLTRTFTEAHVYAITQAICDYRRSHGIDGPLFMGKDTHALSECAEQSALEVLAANNVETVIQQKNGVTPTPVISRAILVYNQDRSIHLADGIVITPSHNPPQDGGIKYNLTNGGPAGMEAAGWIQTRANELLKSKNTSVARKPFSSALGSASTQAQDYALSYVNDLRNVVAMDAICASKVSLAVDPLGGASLPYWSLINRVYGLEIIVTNPVIDLTFSFMSVDHDGKIRMDCSSPYAMARLVALKSKYDLAFGNDPDADRHGVITPGGGLLSPNHYLAVSIQYLLTHRTAWRPDTAVGKTLVSSSLIDRVVKQLNRKLLEMPVGFKWFSDGLFSGSCCFAGEESAGASFSRMDGSVWTTDKDGIIMNLLAAEITAKTGKDPSEHYEALTILLGKPYYTRMDFPASPEQKDRLSKLTATAIQQSQLAGEAIVAKVTQAPGNGAPIGGLKVVAANGWFAARPSGTENIYKIYAESFKGESHLAEIVKEAQEIVDNALR